MRSTTHHDAGRGLRSGRIDVDATEQLGLGPVEDGVVERLVSRDFGFVVSEVVPVLLKGHRRRRPAPSLAVLDPQPLAGSHHGGKVDVDVALADRSQVTPGSELNTFGVREVVR